MISVSIVVPVYSGAAYLPKLVDAIDKLKAELDQSEAVYRIREVILVEDGAIDNSAQVLDELAAINPLLTVLHLSRNFGQHPATIAGILHSSGDWIVTMDEDLQHPPANIPDMFDVVARTRADIVYGRPSSKVHEKAARDFSSRKFKSLIEKLTGNRNITKANSFRLVRGPIARAASSICGHDTYFDIALGWFTQRIEVCEMNLKDSRFIESGKSGYNLKSLLSHARRLAFSSQIKLLRTGALLGAAILVLTVLSAILLIFIHIFAPSFIIAPGWTSLILTMSFFSGVTLFLIGILLEYMSILVMRAHGKPIYFTIDRSSDVLLLKK